MGVFLEGWFELPDDASESLLFLSLSLIVSIQTGKCVSVCDWVTFAVESLD